MATTTTTVPRFSHRLPALFLNHGGGPIPLLNPNDELAALWKQHTNDLLSSFSTSHPTKSSTTTSSSSGISSSAALIIRAIVVVSAHYESQSNQVLIGGAKTPSMVYDYGGFPPESYKLQYNAPGSPSVAEEIHALLQQANIPSKVDPSRGFDHGVFVPLMVMFPDAAIPVVPLSIYRSQDPMAHIEVGKALSSLRDQGVLFIGSGASNHNFAYFFGQKKPREKGILARKFHEKLTNVLKAKKEDVPPQEAVREMTRFLEWEDAEEAHARGKADHFMPFFTLLGTSKYYFPENSHNSNCGTTSTACERTAEVPPRVLHSGHVRQPPEFDLKMDIPFVHVQFES